MPAQKKYLSSPGQRWLKVSAAILGGYFVAVLLQIALGAHVQRQDVVIITSAYLSFFLWVLFMIIPFTFRNGWKAWGFYLIIISVCSVIIYFSDVS
ncbi:MAG: hypothetical protein AAGH79_01380 [Bacteroidota bacterium]